MKKLTLLASVCALLVLSAVTTAPAVVPPKECDVIKVRTKRIQVKADQITCTKSESIIRNYARSGTRPKGWKCQKNPQSKLRWRCYDGRREALGILRN
jgi:hypothetical protein